MFITRTINRSKIVKILLILAMAFSFKSFSAYQCSTTIYASHQGLCQQAEFEFRTKSFKIWKDLVNTNYFDEVLFFYSGSAKASSNKRTYFKFKLKGSFQKIAKQVADTVKAIFTKHKQKPIDFSDDFSLEIEYEKVETYNDVNSGLANNNFEEERPLDHFEDPVDKLPVTHYGDFSPHPIHHGCE